MAERSAVGVNGRRPQMQQALADAQKAAERRARCEAIVARWNAAAISEPWRGARELPTGLSGLGPVSLFS
jgi:hypothetical protein